MQRSTRIAFMTTVGRNVGDEFIREGIRSYFDEVLGGQYEPYYVDKHDLTTLTRPLLDEGETLSDKFRECDIIVQAGAPVYWNNGKYKSYNESWSRPLWYDRIFKLAGEKIILNLGAGAGQKSENDLETLLSDPELIYFARQAGEACEWTTARDPLASSFLQQCDVQHDLLPCPAFHAARRWGGMEPAAPNDLLAINLMKKAGHYRLKAETDERQWSSVIDETLPRLRRDHRLIFVAHDQAEADFQKSLALEGEAVFLANDYRDYIALYGRVKGIVANRVHAAVCAAGFGRPAVIIGNDARIGIARPIGIPACDSSEATCDWICDSLGNQFNDIAKLSRRRIALRNETAWRYVDQLNRLVFDRQYQSKAA